MTTLESYYKNRIDTLLNIDLRPTNTERVFVAGYLTFNLLAQEACIDYGTIYNFYFDYTTLYLGYVSADTIKTYKKKHLDIELAAKYKALTIYPKHALCVNTSSIDEDKISRISWQYNFTNLGNLLVGEVNDILNTDFDDIENIYIDEKTQLIIDAEKMLITIDNKQYDFTIDTHYMYIYSANKHYEKFAKYKNMTTYKLAGSILVLSKAHA